MHKNLKTIVSAVIAAIVLLSLCVPASAAEIAEQSIKFAAYCGTKEAVEAAIAAGASYISLGTELTAAEAAAAMQGKAALIIDAASIDEAEEKYTQVQALNLNCEVYYRVKASAGKVVKWAQNKEKSPKLIGLYIGNIYFNALSCINRFGKYEQGNAVQLQTGNQDGVILHNSVTFMFGKTGARGMFSFTNTEKSAARTDSARSWDDLIARGYEIIETAYPADFAQHLEQNTAERQKLEASVTAALTADVNSGFPNRINEYNKALETAQTLLSDGSCAEYEMADARAQLDEAVSNLMIDDGKKVKGDFEITPGRVAAALFGIALVLSWQIYFRKHWGKK